MKKTRVPQFHSKGNPRGDFYALAFVQGLYVPPTEKSKNDAFLILNYSPSRDFTRFSYAIDSVDGELHAYRRGIDLLDSIETALLTAWYEYEVPPHFWSLFPKREINTAGFASKAKHAKQYWEARRQLCSLLYHFRIAAWFKTEQCAAKLQFDGPVKSLFRFKEIPRLRDPMGPDPENEEICQAVVKMTSGGVDGG